MSGNLSGKWIEQAGAARQVVFADHASTHQHGGDDEVGTATPTANAIPKAGADGKLASGWLPAGSGGSGDIDLGTWELTPYDIPGSGDPEIEGIALYKVDGEQAVMQLGPDYREESVAVPREATLCLFMSKYGSYNQFVDITLNKLNNPDKPVFGFLMRSSEDQPTPKFFIESYHGDVESGLVTLDPDDGIFYCESGSFLSKITSITDANISDSTIASGTYYISGTTGQNIPVAESGFLTHFNHPSQVGRAAQVWQQLSDPTVRYTRKKDTAWGTWTLLAGGGEGIGDYPEAEAIHVESGYLGTSQIRNSCFDMYPKQTGGVTNAMWHPTTNYTGAQVKAHLVTYGAQMWNYTRLDGYGKDAMYWSDTYVNLYGEGVTYGPEGYGYQAGRARSRVQGHDVWAYMLTPTGITFYITGDTDDSDPWTMLDATTYTVDAADFLFPAKTNGGVKIANHRFSDRIDDTVFEIVNDLGSHPANPNAHHTVIAVQAPRVDVDASGDNWIGVNRRPTFESTLSKHILWHDGVYHEFLLDDSLHNLVVDEVSGATGWTISIDASAKTISWPAGHLWNKHNIDVGESIILAGIYQREGVDDPTVSNNNGMYRIVKVVDNVLYYDTKLPSSKQPVSMTNYGESMTVIYSLRAVSPILNWGSSLDTQRPKVIWGYQHMANGNFEYSMELYHSMRRLWVDNGMRPGGSIHETGATQDTIFGLLAPVLGGDEMLYLDQEMIIHGTLYVGSTLYILNKAKFTATNTVTVYGMTAAGTPSDYVFTDGSSTTVNISITW